MINIAGPQTFENTNMNTRMSGQSGDNDMSLMLNSLGNTMQVS